MQFSSNLGTEFASAVDALRATDKEYAARIKDRQRAITDLDKRLSKTTAKIEMAQLSAVRARMQSALDIDREQRVSIKSQIRDRARFEREASAAPIGSEMRRAKFSKETAERLSRVYRQVGLGRIGREGAVSNAMMLAAMGGGFGGFGKELSATGRLLRGGLRGGVTKLSHGIAEGLIPHDQSGRSIAETLAKRKLLAKQLAADPHLNLRLAEAVDRMPDFDDWGRPIPKSDLRAALRNNALMGVRAKAFEPIFRAMRRGGLAMRGAGRAIAPYAASLGRIVPYAAVGALAIEAGGAVYQSTTDEINKAAGAASRNSIDIFHLTNSGFVSAPQQRKLEEAARLQAQGKSGQAAVLINNVKNDVQGKKRYTPGEEEIRREVTKSYHATTMVNAWLLTAPVAGWVLGYEKLSDWWTGRDRTAEAIETLIARRIKTEKDREEGHKQNISAWLSNPENATKEFHRDLRLSAIDSDRRKERMFAPTV